MVREVRPDEIHPLRFLGARRPIYDDNDPLRSTRRGNKVAFIMLKRFGGSDSRSSGARSGYCDHQPTDRTS